MLDQPFRPETRVVRRNGAPSLREHSADICVVGAGISGVSAAIEAARLGRKVILIDGLPALGGQAVNSIIGMIVGLVRQSAEEQATDARHRRRYHSRSGRDGRFARGDGRRVAERAV